MKTRRATKEQTCGQEMAAAAEVPRRWGELMTHVATHMEGHARWVGTDSVAARREHDALMRVAAEYRAIAAAATRAAAAMTAMKALTPAPHDPSRFNATSQARWMRAKVKMQRAFATLLMRHAAESETALAQMARKPAPRGGLTRRT